MSDIVRDLNKIIKKTLPYHTTNILVSYLERAVRKITKLQAEIKKHSTTRESKCQGLKPEKK